MDETLIARGGGEIRVKESGDDLILSIGTADVLEPMVTIVLTETEAVVLGAYLEAARSEITARRVFGAVHAE